MIIQTRACRYARLRTPQAYNRRCLSQCTLDRLAGPVQSYISTSRDPYLNLSIEHHLLQKTAPDSTVLLLYVNRPSIIIGRNQNPWLEVNLALLNPGRQSRVETEPPGLGVVDLVRRRSGGGTVFHDVGNVNWTVISPPKDFTRDKHAEMVVRALRGCGIDRSRVNERHDIVLDQGERNAEVNSGNTHSTSYKTGPEGPTPLKVSGSAYKLTRQRALHHGTCLLSSPNLNIIPDYLHSPAKPYITARGVESVSSPVGNILLDNDLFIARVQEQFAELYGTSSASCRVNEEWLEHELIRKGYDELKSFDWTYLQTPQFTLSNDSDALAEIILDLTIRNGTVASGRIRLPRTRTRDPATVQMLDEWSGQKVHEIDSWHDFISAAFRVEPSQSDSLCRWLERMFPLPTTADCRQDIE